MIKKISILIVFTAIIFISGCAANSVFCKQCNTAYETEGPVKNPLPMCPGCYEKSNQEKK